MVAPSDTSSSSLTFLTWNLAMLARSAAAPHSWTRDHGEAAVREQVLEIGPDLVLFQELPKMVPFVETHDLIRAYVETHQGIVVCLASHQLLSRGTPEVTTVPGCAVMLTFASGLTVANVHLAPGRGGKAERLDQLARIIEASPTPTMAIIGDTNTRVDEMETLADAGLHAPKPPQATWNSKVNRFNDGGPTFTAYFTRALTTKGVDLGQQQVLRQPIEHDGARFHLSDHYALRGRLDW